MAVATGRLAGAGRVTSLDAAFTQFCENSTGSMSGTVRYAAPAAAPVVVTSSNPSTVEGQPVTFTARVAPGTGAGGVVFYDGGTAIGQGSFDANGLARLTSDQLGVGQHAITARVGTSTSAAASQTVLAGATSLWFGSEFGDYIGQGAVASYAPPGSTFSVRGTAADVSVSLDAPASGQWWTVTLAPSEPEHDQPVEVCSRRRQDVECAAGLAGKLGGLRYPFEILQFPDQLLRRP